MKVEAVFFDMDGTIANLYGVHDWLPRLRAYDASPYVEADVLVDLTQLIKLLDTLGEKGIHRGIISWGSMVSPPFYQTVTKAAKIYWLHVRDLQNRFEEIHVVKYGTPKHYIPKKHHRGGVLVDDNDDVCADWEKHGGIAVNAKNPNWIQELLELCE